MTQQTQQKSGLQDFLFIGSGISTAFTLWNFLKNIKEVNNTRPLQICVLDKYGEFNKGIPYGARSGKAVLLITNLKSFLPEPELSPYMEWLSVNKEWLLEEFKEAGGSLSAEWLRNNQEDIEKNNWAELFLPRHFFGCYMDEMLRKIIGEMESSNKIQVNFKKARVTNINRLDDLWMADTENSECFTAKKVIMGIGSLPTNFLWKKKRVIQQENLLFLNDLYFNNLDQALNLIQDQIVLNPNKKINVVIVGANASALEVLYRMNDIENIAKYCGQFYFLSTHGLLPDSEMDPEKMKSYSPANLSELLNKSKITSSEINEAANIDLDRAAKAEIGAASTVGIISDAVGKLLGRLDYMELEKFACFHGNEIGRKQRCAGQHYVQTTSILKAEGRFKHISGRFEDLRLTADGAEVYYRDTASGEICTIDNTISVVINCSGGMTLDDNKVPQVLRKLMQNDLLIPNVSRIGFQVNDLLEANKNFHVIGPLLAGNVVENKAVWHVEHCGRIIWLSKLLSKILADPIRFNQELTEINFEILEIGKNSRDGKIYTEAIQQITDGNPYGSLAYFAHHESDLDKLIAFKYSIGDRCLALMPMVKRPIRSEALPNRYFDVISPYGYSGPFFEENLAQVFISDFWDKVDQWYRDNMVVSEFIRFSLTQNHHGYSGELIPTLKNVQGEILKNQELQWNNFASKVRTNYRKATKYDLLFTMDSGREINDELISDFHKVYIDTMDRNKASNLYFFTLDYFVNLIRGNPNKFAIARVLKDGVIISVELIILHKNCIYAFLGGTRRDYFEMRPNDFLRVEVIRWAAKEGIKYYILGGGRTNDDGLYRHKKAMFPKNPDVIFYTGRKVILDEEYQILLREHVKEIPVNFEAIESSFFPKYRI